MCDALGTISELQEIPKRSVNEVSLGPRLKIPHNLKMPFSSTLLLNLKTIDDLRGGISRDLITWTNLVCFLLILAAFSYVSIEVPLTPSTCSFRTLQIRFGIRPLSTAVSFMASLILPQLPFLYVYPAILLLSLYPPARDHALRSLQVVLPINKVYNIFISTAAVEVTNEPQQDESSSATRDLEANIEAE
ncbi:uncharacterized protein LOC117928504 isoform X2 [Vitis riparia]|uniref:uncharacterized protein LOC117928504 isoform X2 n=1 Tax=Vitis riparia TaxID=96939 RepID=UPI00155AA844|nr:uncharacterized protein LOC117928504 isoform X2 [Vitis riparia]